jgi:hypothetical protein
MYGALAMFCGLLGIDEYRLFNRNRNQDPRPPAVLKYIRDNRLEEKTLLVPQADLPMIHYYFPRTHLVGNNDKSPSYPVRVESPR